MSDETKKIEILRGEPIEISINGTNEKVYRLSVDEQLDALDIFSSDNENVTGKKMFERMVKLISLALKKELNVNDFLSAGEIIECFNKVWEQNQFGFLLKQVAQLNLGSQR